MCLLSVGTQHASFGLGYRNGHLLAQAPLVSGIEFQSALVFCPHREQEMFYTPKAEKFLSNFNWESLFASVYKYFVQFSCLSCSRCKWTHFHKFYSLQVEQLVLDGRCAREYSIVVLRAQHPAWIPTKHRLGYISVYTDVLRNYCNSVYSTVIFQYL